MDRHVIKTHSQNHNHHNHHNHHTSRLSTRLHARCVVVVTSFVWTLAVAMSERVGAAKRRRDRWLRAWHRHEQLTVAMELGAALHHSAQRPKTVVDDPKEEVENVRRDGLRAQKSPPKGVRPGSLLDPWPQRSDRTVRRSAGEAPLLVVASLRGADGVDGTTVSDLLVQNLKLQKEEEERKWREQRKVMKAEFMALMALPSLTPLQVSSSRELVEALEAHDACKPSTSSWRRRGRSVVFLVFLGTVADVPVVMQPMFQQFSEFLVPQFQFLVSVLDIPVVPQRRIRCAVLGLVVTRPLLRNDRCPQTLSVRSCRPRRRQRWYGWFCWLRCTSRCVGSLCCLLLFVGRTKIFGIVVDIDWKPAPARGDPTGAVLGYVIDMPVIVYVKEVDIPVVTQRLFPLVQP